MLTWNRNGSSVRVTGKKANLSLGSPPGVDRSGIGFGGSRSGVTRVSSRTLVKGKSLRSRFWSSLSAAEP